MREGRNCDLERSFRDICMMIDEIESFVQMKTGYYIHKHGTGCVNCWRCCLIHARIRIRNRGIVYSHLS